MRKKRFWCLPVIFCCIFLIFSPRVYGAEQTADFKGIRTIRFLADKSDVSNYINGGRPTLDLALRQSTPEWLSYKLVSDGQDLSLTLSFEFSSYEDYVGKLEQLIGQKPQLVYKTDEELFLLESFNGEALLNFIGLQMNADGTLSERQMNGIFTVDENEMTLNDQSYTFGRRVSIRPDGLDAVKFDKLSVFTEIGSEIYERTLTVEINTKYASENDVQKTESQFESFGDVTAETLSETQQALTVHFEAESIEELAGKTMTCLSAAVSVSEQETYKDDDTVEVVRTEYFDTEALLRNPGKEAVPFNDDGEMLDPSQFYYEAKYPENEMILYSEDEVVEVSGGCISVKDQPMITYIYEKPFGFSEVYMETKKNGIFGKLTREIVFEVPGTIAAEYHEKVKAQLGKNLADGVVFDIYDEVGVRYYKLSYSSYFREDMEHFAADVRDVGGTAIRDDGVSLQDIRRAEKIIVAGVAAILFIVAAVIIIFKIRGLILHIRGRKHRRKIERGWYCPNCGSYNEPQYRFCSRCGRSK